jgi:hypothetical protein
VGVPLDEDHEHATYDPDQVATYFEAAATRAALSGNSGLHFGAVDSGQRLVGDVRPCGQSLLGAAGRSTLR